MTPPSNGPTVVDLLCLILNLTRLAGDGFWNSFIAGYLASDANVIRIAHPQPKFSAEDYAFGLHSVN
jgi:hypothetical protein